ncbi:MAG: hypothetical protein IJM70_09515 [Prevotella sp.]|nr:hypothetical protein [Prevotella sp.]
MNSSGFHKESDQDTDEYFNGKYPDKVCVSQSILKQKRKSSENIDALILDNYTDKAAYQK